MKASLVKTANSSLRFTSKNANKIKIIVRFKNAERPSIVVYKFTISVSIWMESSL